MLAFMSLIVVTWWTRKFGAASLVGFVVAAMTLIANPAMPDYSRVLRGEEQRSLQSPFCVPDWPE
jgi:hypothetical protein